MSVVIKYNITIRSRRTEGAVVMLGTLIGHKGQRNMDGYRAAATVALHTMY